MKFNLKIFEQIDGKKFLFNKLALKEEDAACSIHISISTGPELYANPSDTCITNNILLSCSMSEYNE